MQQRSLEKANELTLRFYEAAQEPSLLPSFVSALGQQFRAHVVGLRVCDLGYSKVTHVESIGMTPHEWDRHEELSKWCNVWRNDSIATLMAQRVGHSDVSLPYSELRKTEYYKAFLAPLNIEHGMGLCLWAQGSDQMVAISLNRSHGVGAFDDDDLAFGRQLLPHFRSAYAIMRRLSWAERKSASFASAIDRLQQGFVLVDGSGKCLYRNEVADNVIAAGGSISISGGELLHCADGHAQRKLHETLLLAAQDKLFAPTRIHLRDAAGVLHYILVVTMLRRDMIARVAKDEPCAAVFIHRPNIQARAPEVLLRDAYSLTPAEARVAAQLGGGRDVAECAQVLCLSMPTVRTHLRNLFAKTGTRRQAELVGVLAFVLRAW